MAVAESETDDLIFVKHLTKSDVDVRLSLPIKALNEFEFPQGKHNMEFKVRDGMKKSWKFGLYKRNPTRNSRPKPVISSGWRANVRAKGLERYDRLFLYRNKDKLATKPRFRIRAERKIRTTIKIFGKEIHDDEAWVDVEELNHEVSTSI